MSARRQGRRAALPPAGFQPPPRLRSEENQLVVRFVPEDGKGAVKDYDFAVLPINPPLQHAFARAFADRTKPSAAVRSRNTADHTFRRLASFAHYLSTLARCPGHAGELTAAQVDGWRLQRPNRDGGFRELGELKVSLRRVPGVSPEFAAAMTQSHKRGTPSSTASTYSRDEFRRILSAARFDVRRAAERIRASRELLAQWRSGGLDPERDRHRWLRGKLLDHVDQHLDVPRNAGGAKLPRSWVGKLGPVTEHVTSLHLGPADAAAFMVLLVGLTGQNPGTITSAPAAHHRPDGYAGPIATAIIELDKPRRGSRRHMDVALVDLPDWVAAPSGEQAHGRDGDDLRSPFGVYTLLHELAAPARHRLDTGRLLVWWAGRGGMGVGAGLREGLHSERVREWADAHTLPTDRQGDEQPTQLRVTLARLRLTYLELHQRPVAHTERTLANDYLLRDRGNITEYRQVVADVLDKEVTKARTRTALRTLSAAEIEHARTDPAAVAARHGLDPATLQRMLAGELDTVMAACSDHTHGPHTSAGQPCRASFMLCLSCPCARALPNHLPLQVAVHDALDAKRDATTPLRWAQRFALPHTQLADLLDRAGTVAVADARARLTAEQRELADRLLNRELDLS